MSRPISDPVFDIGRDLQRAYDEGYKQGRYDEKVGNEMFSKGLWVKQELAPQTMRFCNLCGYKKPRGLANFCPNCGADMRPKGEDNEND